MKTFRKLPGTSMNEFVNVNIANFVLQLMHNQQIEIFYLSASDAEYGSFDDIVVEIENEGGKEIYALQLIHKDKQTLAIKSLAQKRGDFGIVKYFDSFQKCNRAAQKVILFTNLKFNVMDNQPFRLEGEEFYVRLSKFYPEGVFKILEETNNYCYKFSIVADASTSQNSARTWQYKTFFDKFFLYVDQKNVKALRVSTEKKFIEMFLSNKMEFENYLNIISGWSKQDGKKEKLNKKWMQRAIAIHLLSSRTKPLSFVEVNENRKILRQAISDFDITVFEENSYGKVSELWSDAKEDLEEINRLRRKYQLSSTYIDNLDHVDPKLLSQLLWIMGKCPLIVTEDQTACKAIKLCLKDKFIVLGRGLIKEWQKDFSVFQDLSDLEAGSNVYSDVMTNFTCSLQGKEAVSLQIMFMHNPKVLNSVKTDDLLEMLDSPFNVGGEKENLPEPYIDRFLLRNVIDISYLEKINTDTFIIILSCGSKLEDLKKKLSRHEFIVIDDYLNLDCLRYEENMNGASIELGHVTTLETDLEKARFRSTILIIKDECNLSKFQAVCNKNKDAKIYHQFRYRDDGNLDWIRSKTDLSDLENYKLFYDFVEEKILWSSQPHNNINIIISDPGMGKTEVTKSLKNNCSSGFWTVVVYPRDIYSFFKQLGNRSNILKAFENFILNEKFSSVKELDKEIYKTCRRENRVIYIWDALDEISSDNLENVTHIILQLSERSLLQWVTSRQHLKKFLETKFNVLSITIARFNQEEQKFYIKERLAATSEEESEQVINKIQAAFTRVEYKDVLGIPLQIFMLTELFRQNKYLNMLNGVFTLTDLYHYFIEEMTRIYYKDRAGGDPQNFQSEYLVDELILRSLENYQKFALKALFTDDILKSLNVNCETELQSIQTNNSAICIILEVTNGIPRFLHRSFAEYLVAVYFSKQVEFKNILVDIIFQPKYVNIRFFFDLLLAKASPPYIAILYKEFDFFQKCDKEILKRKDAGGRSVLHLACSWGQRYPRLNVEMSRKIWKKSYIIDDVYDSGITAEATEYLDMVQYLANECDILEKDTFFNMTPLSYAKKSDCLFAKLKIFQKQKRQLSSSDSASINILYYSARFEYSDALDLFIAKNLPFIKTKSGDSLLHLACGHKDYILILKLLKTNIYKKKINDKDSIGSTLLHLAAYNNYHKTVIILIVNGAQINVQNNSGVTPLFLASQQGHDKIVKLLTKTGAEVNLATNDGVTPLSIASMLGYKKIVEILIKSGADINLVGIDRTTPLFLASREGHETIVEILIKPGAKVNFAAIDGATPLLMASQKGYEKIVEILIESEADINLPTNDGVTPLFVASMFGCETIVDTLTKFGAETNLAAIDGSTPLFIASHKGYDTIVEILIKSGADINLATNDGAAPLFVASEMGHEKIVEILAKSGAEINLVSKNGAAPLHSASQQGHEKIVELLIESGADINIPEKDGTTPLFIAAQEGHKKIGEILIKFGAHINQARNDGATPLLMASQMGHQQIVEILIKSGAHTNLGMNDGVTPLFIASQNGHEKIVELLNSGAGVAMTF